MHLLQCVRAQLHIHDILKNGRIAMEVGIAASTLSLSGVCYYRTGDRLAQKQLCIQW